MMAEDCYGVDYAIEAGITIDKDMYWEINVWDTDDPDNADFDHPNGFTSSVEVINNLDEAICFVHFSPSTSDEWGVDWLGNDFIAPGESYFFYMDAGTYDMMAKDCYDIDYTVYYEAYVDGEMYWEINTWD